MEESERNWCEEQGIMFSRRGTIGPSLDTNPKKQEARRRYKKMQERENRSCAEKGRIASQICPEGDLFWGSCGSWPIVDGSIVILIEK